MVTLKEENEWLRIKFNHMEHELRRKNIRMFGLPEKTNENIRRVIPTLVNDKLHVKIEEKDIDEIYRIGKHNREKDRPIRMVLCSMGLPK